MTIDNQTKKRLHLAAWRRGIREMDLILGRFYDLHSPTWQAAEYLAFTKLLDRSDRELYDIIAGFQPLLSDDADYPLLCQIKDFAQQGINQANRP